jgi:hypothetical protein
MTSPNGDRSTYRFEVMVAALMALTTLLAAWSGFQSTKWSGIMAIRFNEAGALRSESLRSSNLAATQRAVDVGLFTRWVDAYADGNQELVEFYEQRFPERLGVAVDAWVATEPLTSPDAPSSPFAMTEYRLEAEEEAEELVERAGAKAAEALRANQNGDNYVLTAVLFASVLLFAGIGSKLASPRVRIAMGALAAVTLVAGAVIVFTMPIVAP